MTNRIFKPLLVIAGLVVIYSCGFWEKPKYCESIVTTYSEYDSAEAVLTEFDKENSNHQKYDISIDFQLKRFVYYDTTVDKDRIWFESLCNKYGDNHYHQDMNKDYSTWQRCTVPDVYRIKVTSEEDFDQEHPKGVSLNDCFNVYYVDLKNIIESNYKERTERINEKPLDSITQDEMSMLRSEQAAKKVSEALTVNGWTFLDGGYFSLFGLKATKLPTGPSVQHLTIEFTTEYGNTISCPIAFDFSQSMLARQK